jgi:hypothetical protein
MKYPKPTLPQTPSLFSPQYIDINPSRPPKNFLNIRKLDRLNKIRIHPRLLRIPLILRTRKSRKRNNMTTLQPHLTLKLPNMSRTRQSIHNRHTQVHEHEVKRSCRRGRVGVFLRFAFVYFESFKTVGGFFVAQVLPFGEDDEEFEVDGVIVYEEDARVEV